MRILMSASAVSAILSAAMILFIGMTGAVFAGHHAAERKPRPKCWSKNALNASSKAVLIFRRFSKAYCSRRLCGG